MFWKINKCWICGLLDSWLGLEQIFWLGLADSDSDSDSDSDFEVMTRTRTPTPRWWLGLGFDNLDSDTALMYTCACLHVLASFKFIKHLKETQTLLSGYFYWKFLIPEVNQGKFEQNWGRDNKVRAFWLTSNHLRVHDIVSSDPEGRYRYSKMLCWGPEGRYHHRHCTAIAPFWFSMEHLWILIAPFWLSTDVKWHHVNSPCFVTETISFFEIRYGKLKKNVFYMTYYEAGPREQMKSFIAKRVNSILVNLRYLRFKLLKCKENNKKICHIFYHNFKNIPLYIMRKVSSETYYFVINTMRALL